MSDDFEKRMGTIEDPRFKGGLDLVRRTGATAIQIRFSDEEMPVVWMVVAFYGKDGDPEKGPWEVQAAQDPLEALMRLLEGLMDGGICTHCKRPTGVTRDWEGTMPLDKMICWYRWDPELETFRRGCEGTARA